MMARWLCTSIISALLFGSGCCCLTCGPCGPKACCFCLPCLPKPIVWNGCCNDCGPCPGQSCADNCCGGCGPFGQGGLFPWIRNYWSCGRGCSEVYINEWISDPPDCCDPCDKCYGQFTGQQGYCCLGPAQRLLAALHGYRYCPPPNCGPWCPIFGHCDPCPPCGCGGVGCASCGGGPVHGADIYYQGPVGPMGAPARRGIPTPPADTTNILDENWDVPRARPEPGRPIHNAQQPQRGQMGRRPSPAKSRPVSQSGTVIGSGVRQANYEP
jgi:hypothetical protein